MDRVEDDLIAFPAPGMAGNQRLVFGNQQRVGELELADRVGNLDYPPRRSRRRW